MCPRQEQRRGRIGIPGRHQVHFLGGLSEGQRSIQPRPQIGRCGPGSLQRGRLVQAPARAEVVARSTEFVFSSSTAWRIKGPNGAARKLGLNPSTLYTRMEKLGIPTRREKEQAE